MGRGGAGQRTNIRLNRSLGLSLAVSLVVAGCSGGEENGKASEQVPIAKTQSNAPSAAFLNDLASKLSSQLQASGTQDVWARIVALRSEIDRFDDHLTSVNVQLSDIDERLKATPTGTSEASGLIQWRQSAQRRKMGLEQASQKLRDRLVELLISDIPSDIAAAPTTSTNEQALDTTIDTVLAQKMTSQAPIAAACLSWFEQNPGADLRASGSDFAGENQNAPPVAGLCAEILKRSIGSLLPHNQIATASVPSAPVAAVPETTIQAVPVEDPPNNILENTLDNTLDEAVAAALTQDSRPGSEVKSDRELAPTPQAPILEPLPVKRVPVYAPGAEPILDNPNP
jgi:DNA-binding transcriptional MerR regulator